MEQAAMDHDQWQVEAGLMLGKGRTQQTTASAGRHDMYLLVHKGLRAAMVDVLTTVGRMDTDDAAEVAAALGQVRDLLEMCRSHLEHENRYIHTAMETRHPNSSAATARDHLEHLQAFRDLEEDMTLVASSTGIEREAAATKLYRHLALFVAENFEHMHTEETDNNAVLWRIYTDEQLLTIEDTLVASIAPEKKALLLRWMVPYMSPRERVRLLGGAKRKAPKPVFEGMLALVKPHLEREDWAKLMAALE